MKTIHIEFFRFLGLTLFVGTTSDELQKIEFFNLAVNPKKINKVMSHDHS